MDHGNSVWRRPPQEAAWRRRGHALSEARGSHQGSSPGADDGHTDALGEPPHNTMHGGTRMPSPSRTDDLEGIPASACGRMDLAREDAGATPRRAGSDRRDRGTCGCMAPGLGRDYPQKVRQEQLTFGLRPTRRLEGPY